MGHEIVYCARCQTRILGTELEKGKAFAFSNRFCCGACAPEFLKSLPHAERAELLAALQRPAQQAPSAPSGSSTTMRALRTGTGRVPILEESTRRRLAPAEKSRGPAIVIGAAVVLAVAAVTFFVIPGPRPAPLPARSTSTSGTPPPPAPPPETPKAADALRDARDLDRRQPGDLDGRIRLWEKAVWACEGGDGLAEAKSGLAAALAAGKEAVARDLAPLEAEIGAIVEKESFRIALDTLEAARKRHGRPEWTLALDKRISDLRARVGSAFDAVHVEASAARARGDDARVRAAVERVERWGLPDYVARIRPFLAAAPAPVPAPAAAPAPAANPYPPIWEKAMALAARRDYAGAVKELALHPDGAGDLDVLKKAGAVPVEAREAIGRWTRGQKQSIGYFDAAGRIARVDAPFQKIEDSRLIFGTGDETRAVEIGELAPSTLAALYLARPKKAEGDERAALAFCLIEGDLEGPKAAVDARYWDWARKAAAERGAGRDAEARAIFASALDDADDPAKTVASAVALKDLLTRFADAPFVARNRGAIEPRMSAGRDCHVFADQISGAGAFRLTKPAKGEAAWVCASDGDAAASYVEFSYGALPNVEYRGWVYAGACCLETFEFGIQATGLRAPDPKNPKETVAADPGAPGFAVAKIPFFLRKTHASHGGPKTAARWEWIPIALPKSGEGGPKTVRLLSAHQGLSVAYAAVSATPDFTPRLADVKERERARSARLRSLPLPSAGLVGHWAFDDGQGAKAADSSPRGHHGAIVGAAWTQGKFGGGLRFDGDNSHVELPSTPLLDGLQNGDYTLSAWFKPETLPPGKDSANDANYGIVIKRGVHTGMAYAGHFYALHYLSTDGAGVAMGSGICPPGVFYHVTSTVSRKSGQLRFYVNGQVTGTGTFAPDAAARDYGAERWRIGIGGPGGDLWRWAAKGVIDDVRLYDRALLESEVRALAGPRAPTAPAPAADARPWTALPLDSFVGGYQVENGVLVRIPGTDNAAKSSRDFGDVEMRIRFNHTVSGYLFFAVRQGGEGAYVVQWNRNHLEGMEKKEHELIFTCKGDAVSATLNGVAQDIERRGAPKSGRLQFNINPGAELNIKSIEFRDPR